MAGGIPAGNPDSSFGQKLLAIALVVIFATIGGFLTGLLKGLKVKPNSCFKNGIDIKPISKKVTIPVLVGIIVFGSIARNTFGSKIMDHYPNDWAAWIRTVCLSIILLRGGLELDFEGKGLIVVLLTLLPQLSEACTVALVSRYIFDLPIALCFALGFILGAVSPAVLVPSCMILQEQRYGVKKGIPTTLIAASSFDDIIAITIFGVCQTSAFAAEGQASGSPGMAVLKNLYQIAAGLAVGLVLGYSMKIFNKWDPPEKGKKQNPKILWIKFSIMLLLGVVFPIACDLIGFYEAKYIGIIFYGWQCHYHWKHFKPEHELAQVWAVLQNVLFGSVGAAVLFDRVESSMIGLGLVVIFCGVSARWFATFMVGAGQGFTYKERAFMGFAWIPKATVQAAIGGVVLAQAEANEMPEYEKHGLKILTTAVFAIVFTAPIGAILTNTLGPLWLEHNPLNPVATELEIAQKMDEINREAGIIKKEEQSDSEIKKDEESEPKKDEESETKRLERIVNGELTEQDGIEEEKPREILDSVPVHSPSKV